MSEKKVDFTNLAGSMKDIIKAAHEAGDTPEVAVEAVCIFCDMAEAVGVPRFAIVNAFRETVAWVSQAAVPVEEIIEFESLAN